MRPLTPEDLGVWQGGSQSAGGGQGTLCIGHGLSAMASPLLRNFNLTERRHPKRRGNPPSFQREGRGNPLLPFTHRGNHPLAGRWEDPHGYRRSW